MFFIYTTCEKKEEAEKIAKLIIDNKFGVCVDYWPIESMYNWENKLVQTVQYMVMVSTSESKLEIINDLISQNHSYSVPLIGGVDVRRINRAFKEWLTSEVQ